MGALVAWAGKNRLFSILIALGICFAGLFAVSKLPIDALPDVTNVQVQIVTSAPSLSASEIEAQITQPLERAMAGTPGLVQTRSISKLGISLIWLVFEDDVDVYWARAQVNERLGPVAKTMEDFGTPELGPITTALGEIYMFELRADDDNRSAEELRTMVDWQIGPKLRQVPGVIEVLGFGGALKQYKVTLDPSLLAAHNLSVEQVRTALEKDNIVAGGGFIDANGEQIVLRGDARFRGLEDISDAVVHTDVDGVPVKVGQLGEVDTGPALRQGAMTRDGRGEIIGGSVYMLKGGNSRDVVTRVKDTLEQLKPFLPAGVHIEPYYDRTTFINDVLSTVFHNLTEGAIIVVFCLLLTLGSVRAGLLVAGAIPFAMLVGFIGLLMTGYAGNVMSLGSIDFGIVVEGAVLVVEHAMTVGASTAGKKRRQRAILQAMTDVARPAVFGVVITLLVFLPLITLEGVEGKMFKPVVISLCFMLFGALIYALVFLPAIAPRFLKFAEPAPAPATEGAHEHAHDHTAHEPWLIRKVRRVYEPTVDWTLQRPKTTLAVAFGVTLAMLGSGATIGAEFLPRIFEGAFAIDALRPPSTSLPQAIDLAKEGELAMLETPEVETVVDRIGRPNGAVDPAGPESSDVFVILKPKAQWRKGLTVEQLTEELADRVNARVPAQMNAFSQPIEMRINDLVAGVKGDIAIKVFGDDLETISDVAERIVREVAKVPGAADVKREIAVGLPAVRVKANRDKLARLGIPARAALEVLQMSRAGLPVGVIREGERVFDMVLRLGGEGIDDAQDLGRLPVAAQGGILVPLANVADIESEDTIVQIGREQMKRRIIVQANVRGRDLVGFVKEAQERVRNVEIPKEVEVVWGGQFQNFNRAKTRLSLLVPVSLAVIALMLVVTFRSTKYMIVTLLNLPFAVAGGVLAMVLRGLPFSIPAGVGFIALCGVSVMTGIVMTTNLLGLPETLDPLERVKQAARASLRAPLSTALVAAVGFIPAAIATGTGAEVQRPLATVVIGGLIVAMLVSMVALPVMLLVVARMDHGKKVEEDEDDDDLAPLPAPAE